MRWSFFVMLMLFLIPLGGIADSASGVVYLVDVTGTVTGGTAIDIADAIETAQELGA